MITMDWWGIFFKDFGWVFGAVILLFAGVVILRRTRQIKQGCQDSLSGRYSSDEIVCHENRAYCLGEEFSGDKVLQGHGVLILAEQELYFMKLYPKQELKIPIKKIVKVLTPNVFSGITSPVRLLQVHYRLDDGVRRSVAWKFTNSADFTSAIKEQRKRLQKRRSSKR